MPVNQLGGQLPQGIAALRALATTSTNQACGLIAVRFAEEPSRGSRTLGVRRREQYTGTPGIEYEISWFDERTSFLHEDGVGDEEDAVVRGLQSGLLTLQGEQYEVRWLNGFEFAVANRAMGEPF